MIKEMLQTQIKEAPARDLNSELEGELSGLSLSKEDVDLQIEPDMHADRLVGRIKGHEIDIVCSDTTGAVLSGKIDGQRMSLDDAKKVHNKYLRVAEISTEIRKGRVSIISTPEALKDIL